MNVGGIATSMPMTPAAGEGMMHDKMKKARNLTQMDMSAVMRGGGRVKRRP